MPFAVSTVQTVLTIPRACHARTGTGHRASDWQAAGKPVWEGRLRVVSRGKTVTIELLETDGRLFAQAPVRGPGEPGPPSVEKVVDSSR